MTPQTTPELLHTDNDIAARLLAEGVKPLIDAARDAGLFPLPSLRTLLRAALANRLESLIVAGRRVTSPAAIVRWIAAQHARRSATLISGNQEGGR